MSKIGRLLIKIPDQTTCTVAGGIVTAKGKLGELSWQLPIGIVLEIKEDTISVINQRPVDPKTAALHGLVRAKVANIIKGVSIGFERKLEISGVGFRCEVRDNKVWLQVGFSHPVELVILPGVEVKVNKSEIVASGIDKEVVGEMAARIRNVKKPEPYKGKGIRYQDEVVRRKQGKAAKTVSSN
ncbi:MAG: 50S ribosomal protein L6 [Patescibacteria group bacterium]